MEVWLPGFKVFHDHWEVLVGGCIALQRIVNLSTIILLLMPTSILHIFKLKYWQGLADTKDWIGYWLDVQVVHELVRRDWFAFHVWLVETWTAGDL